MDPVTVGVFNVLMRFAHIAAMTVLIGGALYVRYVSEGAGSQEEVKRHGKWLVLSVIVLIISGGYNFIAKVNIPPGYHLWFGIKMLLALHIIAVSFIAGRASIDQAKRRRLLGGVAISGIAVILLSAYLRYLSNWMTS